MDLIFAAFDITGPGSDARAAILAGLALMLIVMAVTFISSVLLGGGHSGRYGGNDDD